MLGKIFIVRIEKRKIFSRCERRTEIPCHGSALIFAVMVLNTRITGTERPHDIAGIVGRTIIDNNKLPIRKVLCKYAFNCAADNSGAVESRNDDGKQHEFLVLNS